MIGILRCRRKRIAKDCRGLLKRHPVLLYVSCSFSGVPLKCHVGSINLSRSEAKMKGGKNRTSAGSGPPEENSQHLFTVPTTGLPWKMTWGFEPQGDGLHDSSHYKAGPPSVSTTVDQERSMRRCCRTRQAEERHRTALCLLAKPRSQSSH